MAAAAHQLILSLALGCAEGLVVHVDGKDAGGTEAAVEQVCRSDIDRLGGGAGSGAGGDDRSVRRRVTALAASPPELHSVAVGCDDGSVLLWEVCGSAKIAANLSAHHAHVSALAWSPDGALLATGGTDCEVRVWRVAFVPSAAKWDEQSLPLPLEASIPVDGPVAALCFGPDRPHELLVFPMASGPFAVDLEQGATSPLRVPLLLALQLGYQRPEEATTGQLNDDQLVAGPAAREEAPQRDSSDPSSDAADDSVSGDAAGAARKRRRRSSAVAGAGGGGGDADAAVDLDLAAWASAVSTPTMNGLWDGAGGSAAAWGGGGSGSRKRPGEGGEATVCFTCATAVGASDVVAGTSAGTLVHWTLRDGAWQLEGWSTRFRDLGCVRSVSCENDDSAASRRRPAGGVRDGERDGDSRRRLRRLAVCFDRCVRIVDSADAAVDARPLQFRGLSLVRAALSPDGSQCLGCLVRPAAQESAAGAGAGATAGAEAGSPGTAGAGWVSEWVMWRVEDGAVLSHCPAEALAVWTECSWLRYGAKLAFVTAGSNAAHLWSQRTPETWDAFVRGRRELETYLTKADLDAGGPEAAPVLSPMASSAPLPAALSPSAVDIGRPKLPPTPVLLFRYRADHAPGHVFCGHFRWRRLRIPDDASAPHLSSARPSPVPAAAPPPSLGSVAAMAADGAALVLRVFANA